MISLYVPGNSLVHRAPAGLKLLVLALTALVLFLIPPSYPAAVVFVLLPILGYLVAQLSLRLLVTDLLRLSFLLVFLVVTQLIFLDPVHAATNTARLISIILLAQVLTRTTEVSGIVATTEKLFGPLRRFGANPEKIGLALGLMLNSVGTLSAVINQVREAQRARGVRIAPWSWAVPVLVLSLKHADDLGDALTARGLD
ncbi:cobalt transporter [Auritidibacter sp. NML120779]|nr:cobalt transporter [Auritidibacter sp. NML120779]